MLSPFNLPERISLLVTDEILAPAEFLLHQALISHLKDDKNNTVIVLSVSEPLVRWKAIATKANLNVSQLVSSGSLHYIDVQASASAGAPLSLRNVYDQLIQRLPGTTPSNVLVIMDDISTLEWIGVPLIELTRFTRALHGAGATLITRQHLVGQDEPDDLFRHLLQLCTYHIDVRPLSSGRSGVVSGEVALHAGASTVVEGVKLIKRNAALQYRLTDSGSVFFERGTGAAVL